ncbi:MAG TPA: hypothetical protein VK137_18605, partial [Planctomycetaceae bacterium]|nr:hypothetical protein [Planctomycetaceae bacterium]
MKVLKGVPRFLFLPLLILLSVRAVGVAGDRALPVLKAGYLPVSADRNIASKMRTAGLNAVWPKLTNFQPDGNDKNALRRITQWADVCEKHHLQLWPSFNFAGPV